MPSSTARVYSPHRVAPRTAPSWLAILLLVSALSAAVLSEVEPYDDYWTLAIRVICAAAPFIGIGVAVRRWPRPFTYGALAIVQVTGLLMMFVMIAAMAVGSLDAPLAAKAPGMLVVVAIGFAEIAGLLWAIGAIRAWDGDGAWREAWQGVGVMFLWPVVAGVISARAGTIAYIAHSRSGTRAEQALARNVVRIQRCALRYASEHPEIGYPGTLVVLGPRGSKCLDADDIAATHKRYALSYVPEPADENGYTASFVVSGGTGPKKEYPSLSIWADSSGTQRRRLGVLVDAAAPAGDSMPGRLQGVRQCVETMRADGRVPARIGELREALRETATLERYRAAGCNSELVAVAADSGLRDAFDAATGYRISYGSSDDGYHLDARPVVFAETALRSYLMDDGGRVHFTMEDRAATVDDPELPACAPYDVGDCAPTPLSTPPRAQFLHPDSLAPDKSYKLRIRVIGNRSRLPAGLWWRFECNVPPSEVAAATVPEPNREREAETSCSRPKDVRPPVGDSIIVRLWLGNTAGLTTHVDDVIHVIRDAVKDAAKDPLKNAVTDTVTVTPDGHAG